MGVKRPGRGINHPPTCSAEVKERVELYFYSISGPSRPVLGTILLLFYIPSCHVPLREQFRRQTHCVLQLPWQCHQSHLNILISAVGFILTGLTMAKCKKAKHVVISSRKLQYKSTETVVLADRRPMLQPRVLPRSAAVYCRYGTSASFIQGGSNMTGTNCDLFTHK